MLLGGYLRYSRRKERKERRENKFYEITHSFTYPVPAIYLFIPRLDGVCMFVLVVCCMVLELMTGSTSSSGGGVVLSGRVILCFLFFVSLVIDSGILLVL